MALTPGIRLGVYEIAAPIGEGGMGQVYRATDTTLGRQVAIKILPDAFAADPERMVRFEREAKTLASLNHSNIAAIYGFEKSAGAYALVMELVEGEDLSQRIARGAIPLDDALPIARQIAEALEAAHEQGIIHRDLKPANIKVRSDGTVKVLDFGLAKAMEPAAGSSPSMSMSPTITTPAMTQAGMILGTAAYMSPEQARGRAVDKRSDIWAFGAVLLEMLTGRRAFPGEDITDTIVSVMSKEPDWPALPSATSASVRSLLRRCLEKDPKRRLRDIGEARLALDGAFETVTPQATTAAAPLRGGLAWMAAFAVAALVIVALAVPALRHLRETPPPAPSETRLDIVTPASDQPSMFALSPDSRQIVFVASGDGASRLWLRALAATTAQPLAGTEGATLPFWSPDSRSIGFFAGDALKRLDLGAGAGVRPQTLAPAFNGSGGTWNADGVILFSPSLTTPVMRVAAIGGAVTAVTTLTPGTVGHLMPQALPGGRVLFYSSGSRDTTGIYLGALDGSAPTRLTPADTSGMYLPSGTGSSDGGWLLWGRAGTLVAQRLDLAKGMLTGEPTTLADGVTAGLGGVQSALSVTMTGLVAYRTGAASRRQLTWFDRSGTPRGSIGSPSTSYNNPRVSTDGRRVVVARAVQGNLDLWLLDGTRSTRFTFDPARDDFPVWSPDGTRIVFRSTRAGAGDLYEKLTSGAGVEERILASDQPQASTSWLADGRFLMYQTVDPHTNSDLWVMPMTGDRKPSVFLKTPFREVWAAFSPDGRWVAYQSNESGRSEIYVRAFIPPSRDASADKPAEAGGGQWQVSAAGGIHPIWRPDGRELYYINPAGAMMAAPMPIAGAAIAPGVPTVLFPTRIYGGGVDTQQGCQYDVAPDGRFLINTLLDEAIAPITLLTNWNPDAKK